MSRLTKETATQIFLQNHGFVRSVALKNAPTRSLQEDIAQDVYIYFTENADRWDYDESKIKALFRTITENIAGRHWRNHLKNLPENLQKIASLIQKESDSGVFQEESDLDRNLLLLNVCMQKLTPKNRELLELLYFGELTYDELVERTGRSYGAIYTLMSRIRTVLHDCMEKTSRLEVDHV